MLEKLKAESVALHMLDLGGARSPTRRRVIYWMRCQRQISLDRDPAQDREQDDAEDRNSIRAALPRKNISVAQKLIQNASARNESAAKRAKRNCRMPAAVEMQDARFACQ